MSNTALSSARRRRAIPATGPPPQASAAPAAQQAQMQRIMELQMQRQKQLQQQQQQQQPTAIPTSPYTQRGGLPPSVAAAPIPMAIAPNQNQQRPVPPLHQLHQPQPQPQPQHQHQHQQQHQQHFQIVKADAVVPPGYVKLLTANGVYHMESVETGSVNFPYGEPHLAPTIILRNHDLDIIQLQGYHNDISNQIAHLTTMVSRTNGAVGVGLAESATASSHALGAVPEDANMDMDEHELVIDEAIIHKITESHAFIASTVDHIMQNTNLSDLVTEVDSLKTENKDLRSLLTSQQEMMNGMNTLLFTLLNKMHGCEEVAAAPVPATAPASGEVEGGCEGCNSAVECGYDEADAEVTASPGPGSDVVVPVDMPDEPSCGETETTELPENADTGVAEIERDCE